MSTSFSLGHSPAAFPPGLGGFPGLPLLGAMKAKVCPTLSVGDPDRSPGTQPLWKPAVPARGKCCQIPPPLCGLPAPGPENSHRLSPVREQKFN